MCAGSDCCGAWSSSLIKPRSGLLTPELNFAGRVAQAAVKRGLLVYPMQGCVDGVEGDHVLIAPPAVITAEQIDWAVKQLRKRLKRAFLDAADLSTGSELKSIA